MALHFVRWFDPSRPNPLRRDFHSKREAEEFRARLPYLSERGYYPPNGPDYVRPKAKPKPKAPRPQVTWRTPNAP